MQEFEKYLTFPDYDPEEEELKLEDWLYRLWKKENPVLVYFGKE